MRRTRTSLRSRALAVAVIVGVAVSAAVGCTGQDAAEPPPRSTTAVAAPAETRPPSSPRSFEDDQELAEKARLEVVDLPNGWVAPNGGSSLSSSSSSSSSSSFSCTDPPPDFAMINELSKLPHARVSGYREAATSRRLTEEIDVYANATEASKLMTMIRDRRFVACLGEAVDAMMREVGPVGSAPPGSASSGTVPAAGASVFRAFDLVGATGDVVAFDLTASGFGSTDTTSYSVFVRVDRVVAVITVDSKTPPTNDELLALVAAAEAKVRQTLEDF